MILIGDSKGHDPLEGSYFHWTFRLFEEEYDNSASLPKQTFQVLTGYFKFYSWKNDSATAAYRAATTNKN